MPLSSKRSRRPLSSPLHVGLIWHSDFPVVLENKFGIVGSITSTQTSIICPFRGKTICYCGKATRNLGSGGLKSRPSSSTLHVRKITSRIVGTVLPSRSLSRMSSALMHTMGARARTKRILQARRRSHQQSRTKMMAPRSKQCNDSFNSNCRSSTRTNKNNVHFISNMEFIAC